jgi:tetratricopeptide (TPR) repeat protein
LSLKPDFVMIYRLLLFLAFSLPLAGLAAQDDRPTEEEVNREKSFIEANREKLLGNLDKAIAILRELHRQDSKNPAVAFELGRLLDAEHDTEEAIRFLKLATELDGTNEWYAKTLAELYQREGRNKDGAKLYEQLVANDPDNEYLYFRWAYFLVRAQEVDQALDVYEELEKQVGFTEEIARRRHTLYLGMGELRKAEQELRRLTEAFPEVVDYQHLLASFYEQREQNDKATAIYERILELNPEDAKALLALAGGSNQQRDELRYLAELRPAFERADVDVDLKISKLYPFITKVAETGDREVADAAIELTDLMEQVHNSDAKPFSAAGDLYYYSGRKPEAVAKYRATVERDPGVFAVWEQLLRSYYDLGDYKALYRAANEVLDVFPNRAVVQYYLALGADGRQRYDEALDALSLGELMAGRDETLQALLKALTGQVLMHQKDKSGARAAFQEARKLAPSAADPAFRFGEFLLAEGQRPQALELLELAAQRQPDHPHYAYAYARALYADENYAAANEQLSQALPQGAQYWAAALELMGDTRAQLKDIDGAVRYWEQARELAPSKALDQKIANRSL